MPKFPLFGGSKVKRSNLSREEKIDLITKEIAKDWLLFLYKKVTLHRSKENGLDVCSRDEILRVLEHLQNTEHVIKIDPENYPRKVPKRFGDTSDSELIEVKETDPLTFHVLHKFENWYAAYKLRKNIDLKDLAPSNLEKIRATVEDIDKKLQMNPKESVRLDWTVSSSIRNLDARKDALAFLSHKGVVTKYDFHYSSLGFGSYIEVFINIRNFEEFKGKLKRHAEQESEKPQKLVDVPPGTQWEEITIKFLNGNDVVIEIRKQKINADYKAMGFVNKKNQAPNEQWKLLQDFAKCNGKITWKDAEADPRLQKRKELLSKALKRCFGIETEPISYLSKEKAYQIKINLIPD